MKVAAVWLMLFASVVSLPVNMELTGSGEFNTKRIVEVGQLAVITENGDTQILIQGKPIDLNEAKVLEDDDEMVVLEPVESEGVVITFYKKKNQMAINDGNNYIVTPISYPNSQSEK